MKQKYSGRTTSVAPSAAARPTRRRAVSRFFSTLGVETICTAAIFMARLLLSASRAGAGSAAGVESAAVSPSELRSTRSTFGSSHGPVTRNSRVLAAISGFLRKYCARNVPRPIAGLITATASDAVPALISGMTTTRTSSVSRSRSVLPSISTTAAAPRMRRLLVAAMPWPILTSPSTLSKAKPSANRSRKSSDSRRGSDCRLRTLSRRAAPGPAFRNWPDSIATFTWPVIFA